MFGLSGAAGALNPYLPKSALAKPLPPPLAATRNAASPATESLLRASPAPLSVSPPSAAPASVSSASSGDITPFRSVVAASASLRVGDYEEYDDANADADADEGDGADGDGADGGEYEMEDGDHDDTGDGDGDGDGDGGSYEESNQFAASNSRSPSPAAVPAPARAAAEPASAPARADPSSFDTSDLISFDEPASFDEPLPSAPAAVRKANSRAGQHSSSSSAAAAAAVAAPSSSSSSSSSAAAAASSSSSSARGRAPTRVSNAYEYARRVQKKLLAAPDVDDIEYDDSGREIRIHSKPLQQLLTDVIASAPAAAAVKVSAFQSAVYATAPSAAAAQSLASGQIKHAPTAKAPHAKRKKSRYDLEEDDDWRGGEGSSDERERPRTVRRRADGSAPSTAGGVAGSSAIGWRAKRRQKEALALAAAARALTPAATEAIAVLMAGRTRPLPPPAVAAAGSDAAASAVIYLKSDAHPPFAAESVTATPGAHAALLAYELSLEQYRSAIADALTRVQQIQTAAAQHCVLAMHPRAPKEAVHAMAAATEQLSSAIADCTRRFDGLDRFDDQLTANLVAHFQRQTVLPSQPPAAPASVAAAPLAPLLPLARAPAFDLSDGRAPPPVLVSPHAAFDPNRPIGLVVCDVHKRSKRRCTAQCPIVAINRLILDSGLKPSVALVPREYVPYTNGVDDNFDYAALTTAPEDVPEPPRIARSTNPFVPRISAAAGGGIPGIGETPKKRPYNRKPATVGTGASAEKPKRPHRRAVKRAKDSATATAVAAAPAAATTTPAPPPLPPPSPSPSPLLPTPPAAGIAAAPPPVAVIVPNAAATALASALARRRPATATATATAVTTVAATATAPVAAPSTAAGVAITTAPVSSLPAVVPAVIGAAVTGAAPTNALAAALARAQAKKANRPPPPPPPLPTAAPPQ